MKNQLFTILSATLIALTTAAAQNTSREDAVSAREQMVDSIMGKNIASGEVISSLPIENGGYMQLGPQYINSMVGTNCARLDLFKNQTTPSETKCTGAIKPDISYLYVVSKGIENTDEVGSIFYVYFSKSEYQIIKYNPATSQVEKSEIFKYEERQVADFTRGDFMTQLRNMPTNKDIFNQCTANDCRRNEVFQGFIDVNTLDYDGDGMADLMLTMGRELRIHNGKTFAMQEKMDITTDSNSSSSSVVYDFNGDGIDDYLCLGINSHRSENKTYADVEGKVALSHYKDGKLTYEWKSKNMKREDIGTGTDEVLRSTMTMRLFYPEGKYKAPKLAIATCEVKHLTRPLATDEDIISIIVDYGKLMANPTYIFAQKLTVVDFSSTKMETEEQAWYTVAGSETKNTIANIKNNFYTARARPFLFGKPALCAAFIDGFDNPQNIFWVNSVYSYNNTAKKFTLDYKLKNLHEDQSEGIDRVVGGQVEPVRVKNEFKEGKEIFSCVLADTKSIAEEYFSDFDDVRYKLSTVWKDGNDWTISYLVDYDRSNDKLLMFSLATTNVDRGAKLELVKKRITCSNPIVTQVLCAPPYQEGITKDGDFGSMSFGSSTSQTTNSTVSTNASFCGYVEESIGCKWLKFAYQFSAGSAWSKSASKGTTITRGTNTGYSGGKDFVIFNYMPADEFIYKVTECAIDPSMVGKEITFVKVRDNQICETGLTVDKFNKFVYGTSCPQISEDVLKHTVGDFYSYPSLTTENSIKKAFDLSDDDMLIISDSHTTMLDGTQSFSLGLSNSTSKSQGESSIMSVTVSFSAGGDLPINIGGGIKSTEEYGWTHSVTWSESNSITCTLPKAACNDTRYSCQLVWYQHKDKNADGTICQNYMVGNWYITGGVKSNSNAKLKAMDHDTDGIDGIENTGKQVESVKYFDINGCEHVAPTSGLNIKVTTFTDGTKSSVKMMNRI